MGKSKSYGKKQVDPQIQDIYNQLDNGETLTYSCYQADFSLNLMGQKAFKNQRRISISMEGLIQVMSRQSDSNGPMKYEIDVGTINQVIYGRIKEEDDVRVCLMLDALSLDSKDIVKEDFKEKFYFPNIENSLEFIEVIKYVHNFLP